MSDDRVVLTAELKDQMSAPLSKIKGTIEGTARAVDSANKKQASSTTTATAQIDKAITKQRTIFGTLPTVFAKADKAASGLFSGTASAVSKHLTTAADKARAAGEKVGDSLDSGLKSKLPSFSGTLKTVAGMVGGFLVGSALAGGISRALNIEDAQAKLKGLGHDTTAITEIMNNASASVKGTAFGLGDAATVAAGAVAAGIQPGKDLERVLGLTGDAATIAGTELGEMGSIFNKVAASGKLQGDVIAQLQDAGVPVLQFVAKEIGKTAAETSKLASDGEIDFATFANAMEAGLGGAALASGDTFRGAIKNMKAAVSRIAETVITPFLGLIKSGANAIIPVLDGVNAKLKPLMQSFTDGIAGVKSAIAGGGTIQNIAEAFGLSPAAAAVFASIIGPARAFILTLTTGATDITSNGLAGWFEGVAVGINNFMTGLGMTGPEVDGLGGKLDGMVLIGSKVREFFDGLVETVTPLLPKLGEIATSFAPSVAIFESLLPILPTLIDLLGQVAEVAGDSLGTALDLLAPVVESTLGGLAAGVDALTGTEAGADILAGTIAGLGGAYAAYEGAVATAGAVQEAYGQATEVVSNIKKAYETVVMAVMAAQYGLTASSLADAKAGKIGAAAYLVKAAALKVATGATNLFNAAMKANPIAKIITVVSLLVAGLVWFFTQTEMGQAIVQAAWAGIKGAIAGVVDWWNSTLIPALQTVGDFFASVWGGIVDFWNGVLIPAIQSLGEWFSTTWSNITTWVSDAVATLMSVLGAIGAWFASTFGPAISAIGEIFRSVFDWISLFVSNAVLIIQAVLLVFGTWLTATFGPVISAFGSFFGMIWDGIMWAVQRFVAGVQIYINLLVLFWQTILFPAVQAVGDFFKMIWDGILLAVQWVVTQVQTFVGLLVLFWQTVLFPALQAVGDFFKMIWDGIMWAVQFAISLVQAYIGLLVAFWNSVLVPALQWIGDLFASIWNGIVGVIEWVVGLVQSAIQGMVDFWNGTLSPAISAVAGWFSEKLTNAISGVTGFIDNVKAGFQRFVDFIQSKVQPIIDTIAGAFDSLGSKLSGLIGNLQDFAANPLGGAADWAESVLGAGNSGGGVYAGGGIAGFAGGGVAGFAGGGVLGGYAPGRDTIPAILSKGEAVLVPELVRAIGPHNIMAANAAASNGRPAGGGPSPVTGRAGDPNAVEGFFGGGYSGGGVALAPAPSLAPISHTVNGGTSYGDTKVVIEKVEINLDNSGGGMTPADVEAAVEEGIEKAFTKARKRDY